MSTDERYEGWTNRETWAVALHINNDQGWQESVHEALREAIPMQVDGMTGSKAGEIVRDSLDGIVDLLRDATDIDTMHDLLTDIGSLWRVNWTELGASFLRDLAEQDEYEQR